MSLTSCGDSYIQQEIAIDRIDTSGVYITYSLDNQQFEKRFELDVSPENFYESDSMVILIDENNPENVQFESIIHREYPEDEVIIKTNANKS